MVTFPPSNREYRPLTRQEITDLEQLAETPADEYQFDDWEATFVERMLRDKTHRFSVKQIRAFEKIRDKVWNA